MKKASFTLFICAIALALTGQQGLHVGIQLIPQSPFIINQNNYGSPELEYRFTTGYAAGVELGYHFTDQLGVFTGLQYSSQGQKYQDQRSTIERQVMLDYWQVPFYLRFSSSTEGVGFYANAGIYAGFLSSAEIDHTENNLRVPDASDRFSDADLGLLGGLGAQINFSRQFYGTVGLRFTYGLQDINAEGWRTPNTSGIYDPSYNATAGIRLGLTYVFDLR